MSQTDLSIHLTYRHVTLPAHRLPPIRDLVGNKKLEQLSDMGRPRPGRKRAAIKPPCRLSSFILSV